MSRPPARPDPAATSPSQASTTREERIRRRSAERRSRRREELHRVILDAATALFTERGYEGFSLRQVAEEIGYSATTIYNYFADKDDLLLHVALEGFRRFGDRLQAAYEGTGDPLERFAALGRAYVEFGLEHPVHYRLMFLQRSELLECEPPEGYEPVVDAFALLERTAAEGIAAGVLAPADPREIALHAWSFVHGQVALAISVSAVAPDAIRAALPASLDRLAYGFAAREGG